MSVQDPIQLSDFTEPQPDLALLQYRADFYAHAHPVADDVLLVIEVSDSSLEYDRDEKLPRYAHAHISEVWIVSLPDQTIEQYTQPRSGKYLVKRILEVGDTLISASVPALTIELASVFA